LYSGSVAGQRAIASDNIPAATLIYSGSWDYLLVGTWGPLELEISPYGLNAGDFPAYAGAAATRRWDPSRDDWESGAENDFRNADQVIDAAVAEYLPFLSIYALRRTTIARRARADAEQIIERYWNQIRSIADALLVHGRLDGADVVRLCEQ
jgi:hypothetical protein